MCIGDFALKTPRKTSIFLHFDQRAWDIPNEGRAASVPGDFERRGGDNFTLRPLHFSYF
jgi:hypothetical protein